MQTASKYLLEYPAKVLDIKAPTGKEGSLKLFCPDLWEKNEAWIPPKRMLHSGSNGFFILPEPADVVTVSLQMGDPLFPQWDFGYWLADKMISEVSANYTDSSVWKFGPATIEMDRAGKKLTITNESATIEMDEPAGRINIRTGSMQIEMDDSTGKFKISNQTTSLLDLFSEMLELIKTSKTPTQMGPQVILPPDILKAVQLELKAKTLLK